MKITNKQESDINVIAKYFAKGISTKEYLTNYFKKRKKMRKSKKKYQKIEYNFEDVLSYREIERIIRKLNSSKMVKVEFIGKSVDKRNIYALEGGKGIKTIIFDACIHGTEIAGSLYILKYIINLINKYENKNKSVKDLLNEIKIIVIPVVNPDGYELSTLGKKAIKNKKLYAYKNRYKIDFEHYKANFNGVDINRNFPSQNAGLYYKAYPLHASVSFKETLGRNDFFAGKILGKEPETKALMYIFNKYLKNTFAYISLHSAGRVIYSGKPNLSEEFNLNSYSLGKAVSKINRYKAYDKKEEEVGQGNDGTSTDFFSELTSGFIFSTKTKRLSSTAYLNPKIKLNNQTKIITIETLKVTTKDIKIIKREYYDYKLEKVFNSLLKKY